MKEIQNDRIQDGKNQVDDILFNLELQTEDDKTANLIIRENDDIESVVDNFCISHNYDSDVKNVIMAQIMQAIDQNIEDRIFV